MNQTTPEKCPKCMSPMKDGWDNVYACGTVYFNDGPMAGRVEERQWCVRLQRDQLTQRVKELEEAGDRMAAELNRQCAPHWEDALARLWRLVKSGGRPVDQAKASACAVIQDSRRGES